MKKALLICGIVSSVLYVGTDILASMLYPGYSYVSQMVSELGAIGAPTRPLWFVMSLLYNPLVIAFGIGVRMVAEKRSLRIAGTILMVYGVISALGPFVPMQVRGSEMALTDVLHIACTAGIVGSIFLFVGFGANASGKGFRIYSIATIVAILVGGIAAGIAGGQMVAGGATPGMGILERVNIYSEMLWVAMLGVTLLKARAGATVSATRSSVAPHLATRVTTHAHAAALGMPGRALR